MRVLSLFSGGGLGDYGLELAGMEIVGQVEIDDYCQKILKLRWPHVPKWKDIKDFHLRELCLKSEEKQFCEGCHDLGRIDLISGGFPCQDISTAGKGAGITGERSGLWKEMLRIICEIRPRYVLVENVTALLGRGLGTVLGDLAEGGYDTEWDCIPASALGAPHRRDRIWIVGWDTERRRGARLDAVGEISEGQNADTERAGAALADSSRIQQGRAEHEVETVGLEQCRESGNVADPTREGLEGHGGIRKIGGSVQKTRVTIFSPTCESGFRPGEHWAVEPDVGRVAHGVANRVDRLKLLGNGQVVQNAMFCGLLIQQFDQKG